MTIYKKGTTLKVPISFNADYKVKTIDGYEKPISTEKHFYKGPMLTIWSNAKKLYSCIPEHECLVYANDKLIEKKAKDLKSGDIFKDVDNNTHTITKVTEKLYADEFVYSFHMPSRNYYVNDILTKNCCRLRLDLKALSKKNGSLFGSGENTGSIGVVTINLPKIGYLSHSEKELFERIEHVANIAAESLNIKRKKLNEWLESGLYPYTKRYLTAGFSNHFSTIGVLGMNELCRNFFMNTKKKDRDISTKEGKELTLKIMDFLLQKCSSYQEKYKDALFNLESTPAESTSYRFAYHDRKKYPDIISAGTVDTPYYTNSTNLPVGFTTDPWEMLAFQEPILQKYTGGCVAHVFMDNNAVEWERIRDFVKKAMYNTKVPYITISPTLKVCNNGHGMFKYDGSTICPKCKETAVDHYTKKLNELKENKKSILEND